MKYCSAKKVHENGRIVIPKDICKELNINKGDTVIVRLEDSSIIVEKLDLTSKTSVQNPAK